MVENTGAMIPCARTNISASHACWHRAGGGAGAALE
jgi:hypothetical protein